MSRESSVQSTAVELDAEQIKGNYAGYISFPVCCVYEKIIDALIRNTKSR